MARKISTSQKFTALFLIAAALMMFTFCGCTINNDSNMLKGVLVDSPLGGIDYTSYTYSGITGTDGGFKYFKGYPITFTVGGIELGEAVQPKPVMSLMDLVPDATDVTNPTVTNMARFLQSLDNDHNLSNGIIITKEVKDSLKGRTIDFDQSPDDFTNDSDVKSLFEVLGKPLISAEDAQNHFKETLASYFFSSRPADEQTEGIKTLTLLQTSDMHDHASGYGHRIDYTPLDTTDCDTVKGGYSRLAAKIKEIRGALGNKNVLLVDSGDFFMGTIYDMSMPPLALAFFQAMDYDAVTLGNHEFDWSPAGLYQLLNSGIAAGFKVPIVASTINASDDEYLTNLINNGNIKDKLIITTDNGLKIGIISLEGANSIQDMPAAYPVTFYDQSKPEDGAYAYVQSIVDDLRKNDKVDLVIALSHSGIRTDGTGDDADWAANVDGIDIIASGHYHTATHEPFVIADHPNATSTYNTSTIIFSPGSYTRWLSRLDIVYSSSEKKIIDHNFTLIPIDDTIKGDPDIQAMVDTADTGISSALEAAGLPSDTAPVSSTSFDLTKQDFAESSLGNLCADSIRFTANRLAKAAGESPYDIGVVADGVIRDDLLKGKSGVITFSDAYNVLPLGISPWDQSIPGYPLMSIYVTGPEIRTVCEISAILSILKDNVAEVIPGFGPDVYLHFSGLRYKYYYDPNAAQYTPGRLGMTVWQVSITSPDDYTTSTEGIPIDLTDNTTLYRVVVDYYALQMMGIATSRGFSIVPKDANGSPIDLTNLETLQNYRIDGDPATEGVQELKEWTGLMQYFQYIKTEYNGQIPADIYGEGGTGTGRSDAAMPPK